MRPDAGENSQISPSTIVRPARAAGSNPHLASVLLQRWKRRISRQFGVIRGIPDNTSRPELERIGTTRSARPPPAHVVGVVQGSRPTSYSNTRRRVRLETNDGANISELRMCAA